MSLVDQMEREIRRLEAEIRVHRKTFCEDQSRTHRPAPPALSVVTGDPIAWAEIYDGKIVTVQLDKSKWHTTPLYLGAPAEQMVGIVPPHCTGYSFGFEPGVLHVKKDGSGHIVVNEEDFILEDDRCEGPDGPEGSVHWIVRLDASEIVALRDFLNGAPTPAPHVMGSDKELRRAANALLNTLWQLAYSGSRSFEENWEEMDRRFPQARWLHDELKAISP